MAGRANCLRTSLGRPRAERPGSTSPPTERQAADPPRNLSPSKQEFEHENIEEAQDRGSSRRNDETR